ncbi:hypothetical protein PDJAM_G00025810, partial [Pangasius djambal]|nr:hypothetical protein [Pangasius djambal]
WCWGRAAQALISYHESQSIRATATEGPSAEEKKSDKTHFGFNYVCKDACAGGRKVELPPPCVHTPPCSVCVCVCVCVCEGGLSGK